MIAPSASEKDIPKVPLEYAKNQRERSERYPGGRNWGQTPGNHAISCGDIYQIEYLFLTGIAEGNLLS